MNNFSRLRERLPDHGLDAMLVTSEVSRRYVTGFHSTAGVALVTGTRSFFFTDSRYTEDAATRIKDAEVRPVSAGSDYYEQVKEALDGAGAVGFEDACMSYAEYGKWSKKLETELVPAQALISTLRESKSADEIELMKRAQAITDEAFLEVLELIKPGVRETDISAELQYRQLIKGAEGMSFPPIVVSGQNSSLPHGAPGERRLEKGDFVTMDFGCVCGGYCSDMTRTVAVGCVTEEMRLVYETVLAAQKVGISAFRAGVIGKEVDAAARKVIDEAGYGEYFGHGFGHALGMEVHETPGASPSETRALPEGAVISAEPGIYLPGRFGVRIEDVVIVTGEGAVNITKSPKELLVI